MEKNSLLERLTEYSFSEAYPFHMPGHKRQELSGFPPFPVPYSIDITEIEGFDNLHHAEGILKESMEHMSRIYGSDRSWYLVNGSTGGILSAVSAALHPGEKLLMGRNCHKSAYHAVMLNYLEPVYLYPEEVRDSDFGRYGISGGIEPEEVERCLSAHPEIKAVFITSPTYEGIVSDVEAIAEAAHRHGVPLIVDEAHGAHFPFGREFPASALACGADVVIQSLHKTLPSLTQTAVLHLKGTLVKEKQLEYYLSVYQSSSPSYLFLAAMERCIRYMDGAGRQEMTVFGNRLRRWMAQTGEWKCLKILDDRILGTCAVKARDLSKLVILTPGGELDGVKLASLLREEYHLETEMACSRYVICMTSLMDTEEGFRRLMEALTQIDRRYSQTGMKRKDTNEGLTWMKQTIRRMLPAETRQKETEFIGLEEAVHRTAAGFITVYPPGVPALVPGEVITEEAIELICRNYDLGLTVEGVVSDAGERSRLQIPVIIE